MQYVIGKYTPPLRNQIVRLQTHLWSPDTSLNSAYFQWKYESNPYSHSPSIHVAICDQEVVGMRAFYAARWRANNPSINFDMLCAGDSVILPQHRNTGLLTALIHAGSADVAEQTCPYICSLSTGHLTFLNSLALGWRCAGFIETMYLGSSIPERPFFPSKRFFVSAQSQDHPFFEFDRYQTTRSSVRVDRNPQVRGMAELVKLCGNDGRISHVRDQDYFAWRFQNPLCEYRFLYRGEAQLDGYLVLQSSIYSDRKTVSIVDWEAIDMEIRKDLLQTALRMGNFNSLMIWSSSLSASVKSLLREMGFQYLANTGNLRTSRHTLLVKALCDESSDHAWLVQNRRLLTLNDWDLRMIYSDGF